MKIDPDALNGYLRDLAQQQEAFETAKRKIEYLKLQIKQTRVQIKLAKQDPLIKEFIKRMPKDQVSVTPSPGLTMSRSPSSRWRPVCTARCRMTLV